jgi:glycine/D-amino acid oxidase-like deaminating enzyme
LEAQCESWRRTGIEIEIVDRHGLKDRFGTERYPLGAFTPSGGCIQPLSYARGLARAATGAGATIHGDSPAQRIEKVEAGWWVETPNGHVVADQVLLCTNGYTDGLWARLKKTVIPVVSVQIATDPLSDNIRSSMLPGGETIADTRRQIYTLTPRGSEKVMDFQLRIDSLRLHDRLWISERQGTRGPEGGDRASQ